MRLRMHETQQKASVPPSAGKRKKQQQKQQRQMDVDEGGWVSGVPLAAAEVGEAAEAGEAEPEPGFIGEGWVAALQTA